MREDEPPSSPKKQQLINKQKLGKYVDSKTSTSRKSERPSKLRTQLELRKQEIRRIHQDLMERYEAADSMDQQKVYVESGRLPLSKNKKQQVQSPEKHYKTVVWPSQPQALPKGQCFHQKGGVFLSQQHAKSYPTVENKYQQAKQQNDSAIQQNYKRIFQQQPEKASNFVKQLGQQSTNQKRSNLSICQTLKVMLAQGLEKHHKILEKYMYDVSNTDPDGKILKKTKLARLLEKVFIKKTTMATSEAIDELAQMADELRKYLLNSLAEQEEQEYLSLANQYNQRYKNSKKGELNKMTKSFSQFMKKYPMTPYMGIKLDLLSYFLRNNIEYEIKYGKMYTDVVTPIILAKVLTIDKEDIDRMRVAFEDKWNFVSLDYYEQFEDLIILTTLVAIRQKVENNQQKKLEQIKQKRPQLSNYTRLETDFNFKFSRLAFQTEGMLIKTIRTQKRLEIIQSFKKIINQESRKERKDLILHLKRKFTVAIKQLACLIDKLEHHGQQFLIEYEEQVRLQVGIKELPWHFYSPKSEGLKRTLRNLSQCSVTSQQLYEEDNYFATVICRMIVERMKDLSEFTSAAIKWQKKYAYREFIFVHRLDYSYNRMLNLEDKDDLVATLIMGTARGKIIFTKFVQKDAPLTDKEYRQQLQAIFDRKLKIGIHFGVLLYQFGISKKFDLQEYATLKRHFWQRHRAIILAAGSFSHFHLHFALDFHVKKWVRKNSKEDINKHQFFAQLRSKICFTAGTMTRMGAIDPIIHEQ